MARYPQTAWQRSDDRHSTTAQAHAARDDGVTPQATVSDEADAAQSSRERPPAERVRALLAGSDRALAGADRALAVFLQVATVCFVLFALALIAESL
jgi:hypothetical protein